MYFSRASIKPIAVKSKILADLFRQAAYSEHKLLWNFFPNRPEAARDFLYRRYESGDFARYYILSTHPPEAPSDAWCIETKPFDPVIKNGTRFAFQLRVNPVVSKRDKNGKQKRDDVVMELRHSYKQKGTPLPTNSEIVLKAGLSWIMGRAGRNGFSLDERQVLVEAYHRLEDLKRKENRTIRLGVMDFSGILRVEDSETFRKALYCGIGPAKAFGCGLLLLRNAAP